MKRTGIAIMTMFCTCFLFLTAIAIPPSQSGESASLQEARIQAEKTAVLIDNWMNEQTDFIVMMAESIVNINTAGVQDYLQDKLKSRTEFGYVDLYIGYSDDTAVMGSGWQPVPEWKPTQRSWYIGAVRNAERTYISDTYLDAATGELTVTISRAVVGDDGKVIGVVSGDIFLSRIEDIMNQLNSTETIDAFLTDSSGFILMYPNNKGFPAQRNEGLAHIGEICDGLFAPLLSKESEGAFGIRDEDRATHYIVKSIVQAADWNVYIANARR